MGERAKLLKKDIEMISALTPMQEGILYHYLQYPESTLYFEQLALQLMGMIDLSLFKKAWQAIIVNNEVLRTVFLWEKLDKPIQIILKHSEFDLRIKIDSRQGLAQNTAECSVIMDEILQQDRQELFDLEQVPFRVTLVELSKNHYGMLISHHHILYDGWSTGIILKEFFTTYNQLVCGTEIVKTQKNQYVNYVKWLQRQDEEAQEAFWSKYLEKRPLMTELPIKHKVLSADRMIENYPYVISQELAREAEAFVKKQGITLAVLLYSTWGVLLQRYVNSRDIIFGTTVSGRNAELEQIVEMVGLFINTLPLRVYSSQEMTGEDLLKNVAQALQDREAYSSTSLVDIKRYAKTKIGEELFDTLLVLENYPLDQVLADPENVLQIKSYQAFEATHFDLTISITALAGIDLTFIYKRTLFSDHTIKQLAGHFERIFTNLLRTPEKRIDQIEFLTEDERRQLLVEFNTTPRSEGSEQLLHQLFEKQAEVNPAGIALRFANDLMTFAEVNKRANQVAQRLRKLGVQPDSFVGIMLERSFAMIIGILATLKSGGAYLPIDPDYPTDRIRFMLEDSKTQILLTQKRYTNADIQTMDRLNLDDEELYQGDDQNLSIVLTAKNLAYLIYTSGSTGRPKGVMIEHHSVLNRLSWLQRCYPLVSEDTLILKTPFTFDVSVLEIYWGMLTGNSLCLLLPGGEKDPQELIETIEQNRISHINFVPSMLRAFLEYVQKTDAVERLTSLKWVFSSGEELKPPYVELFDQILRQKNGTSLANLYGPTEATVEATYYNLDSTQNCSLIPIGKPVDQVKLFVIDDQFRLVPLGVPGELCISGVGLAQGYLNRPELTAKMFIDNPYSPGEKMYRTGDLARWRCDGNVEYLGRLDYQVKVRGFRIELGEIESRLLEISEIISAVVTVRSDHVGEDYLCAYLVSSIQFEQHELRERLASKLPVYMIPDYYIYLPKLPLNHSGKIDRKALPEPELHYTEDYVPPENPLQERLAQIWASLLNIKTVGIDSNFLELGGHSLKAISLITRIHKEFEVKLPLAEVLKRLTIRELAEYIEECKAEAYQEIQKAPESEFYPLASAQKRIFILQQLEAEQVNYNIPIIMELIGELDLERLRTVFMEIIARQENLRTGFELVGGEPCQKVYPQVSFDIEHYEDMSISAVMADFVRPFDLAQPPLMRVGVIQKSVTHYYLLIDLHHIIADGVSMDILEKEFLALYENAEIPALPIQYKDYSVWQESQKSSNTFIQKRDFWLAELQGELPVINLPYDYPRPTQQSYEGESLSFELTSDELTGLHDLALAHKTTLYMLLLSIFNIFLAKITNQSEIIIGTPVAGREHSDLSGIIGMFVNTLVLRNQVNLEETFTEFLDKLSEHTLAAFANQEYPFEDLVEKVVQERNPSRNPIFDVMFALQTFEDNSAKSTSLQIQRVNYELDIAKFDLSLYGVYKDELLTLTFEYCTKLYKSTTIRRFVTYFKKLLQQIVNRPEMFVRDIELIPESEKQQILLNFNQTRASYPQNRVYQELFESQVDRIPDHLAITYQDKSLSYRELDLRSNQLARSLRDSGVTKDSLVGIVLNPSLEMVVGILGVLKAGGAYLPIAPENPDERIRYIIEDSQVEILLTQAKLVSRLNDLKFSGKIYDLEDQRCYSENAQRLDKINQPEDLVYVIYTSGSTGKPKGVMIEHRSLINLCYWHNQYHQITEDDRVAKYAGFGFDASIMETFPYLIKGARIYILENELKLDLEQLNKYYENHQITVGFLPTRIYEQYLNIEAPKSLRIMITGGEKLKDYRKAHYRLVDYYGPTENTVVTSCNTVQEKSPNIPIGKPIANNQIIIINTQNQLQPIGVPGELCVAGDGLARGYLHRKDLTRDKFSDNILYHDPMMELISEMPSARMYRTGDLARWLEDGSIEFLGRIDRQVKIRGYRIELGEIENQLKTIAQIQDAVVVDLDNNSAEKYLAAYLVSQQEIDQQIIHHELSKHLPEYMIPAVFVRIEAIPFTPNGKLDHTALPEPTFTSSAEFIAPKAGIEEQVAEIWQEVLGVTSVGVQDNFFNLGGHSLKAVNLLSRMKKELGVTIPLKELFQRPTIAGIIDYVKQASKSQFRAIEQIPEADYYPTSSAQKRLFIINEIEGPNTVYNLPGTLLIEGILDHERFERVFKTMLQRHQSLRTSFDLQAGEPVQIVHETIDFKVQYYTASRAEVSELVQEFVQPFDLRQPPLLRVGLIEIDETTAVLLFDMHHTISDGVSMQIFVQEFIELYQGNPLVELRLQYKDYAYWQSQQVVSKDEEYLKQEAYWISEFKSGIPVLNLPVDYPRPARQNFRGASIKEVLSKELSAKVFTLITETETTLFMCLLAAYNILLSKYARQEDILVGTPIAGRSHADLEKMIGMFVNTLVLRNQPMANKTFREFLTEVKENALKAYENQDYQFDDLVNILGIERDPGRNPLFDALIVSRDKDLLREFAGLKISPFDYESHVAHFDLLLEVSEQASQIELVLEYATALFKPSTAEKMLERYVKILEQIVENPDRLLHDITIYHDLLAAKSVLSLEDTDDDFGF